MATISLKVFGARNNLHSGQYGNFSPNPVFGMSRLLAGMKDEQGRVLIPGYYDGVVLSDADKKGLATMPEDMNEILKTLGIAEAEQVGNNYGEALQYPSLNVRGLRAAWVGEEVRTLVPAEAIAEIDMRLVLETPAERMIGLVRKYIEDQGYYITEGEPTEEERMTYPKLISFKYRIGSRPFRTDLNSGIGMWLGNAMEHVFDDQYVKMRTTGGSQPIAPFITTLDIPAVSIRIPNPDNSIHAPNENIRIGNYLEGIQMCLSILTQPFH
jgi:acetylornithine deacetylase/succinyl-diaminopimelate desuccinylase-like protein